jgi:TPR repeat protein
MKNRFSEARKFFDGKKSKLKAKQAFEIALEMAENGNADACCIVGNCYDFGEGVRKSTKNAFKWYKRGSELGDRTSAYNLHLLYRDGIGTTKSKTKSIAALLQSVKAAYPDAIADLGYAKFHGEGVRKNVSEGLKLYLKASKLGVVRARYNLGLVYLYGETVPANGKKAVAYLKSATQSGHSRAPFILAKIYAGEVPTKIKSSKTLARRFLAIARKRGIKDKIDI